MRRQAVERADRPRMKLAVGVGLAVLAVGLMVGNELVRGAEAQVSAAILRMTTGTTAIAIPAQYMFLWNLQTSQSYGLFITADCSSAFMMGPTIAFAALLCLSQRLSTGRVLTGALVAGGLLFLVNIARMLAIAVATTEWGPKRGYGIAHAFGGSMITIAGAMVAVAILLFVVFGGRSKVADVAA